METCPCCKKELTEDAAKYVADVMEARRLVAEHFPEGCEPGDIARKPVELLQRDEVAVLLGFLAISRGGGGR